MDGRHEGGHDGFIFLRLNWCARPNSPVTRTNTKTRQDGIVSKRSVHALFLSGEPAIFNGFGAGDGQPDADDLGAGKNPIVIPATCPP